MYIQYSNGETLRVPSSKEIGLKRIAAGLYRTTDGRFQVWQYDEGTVKGLWMVEDRDNTNYRDPYTYFDECKADIGQELGLDLKA